MRKGVMLVLMLVLAVVGKNVNASEVNLSNWMKNVNDNLFLSELSIPGSHESCATKGIKIPIINKDYGKCQKYTISEQLNMGVRFLDIRCKSSDDSTNLAIHHGQIYQNLMFGDVLNQCQDFLGTHPEETILMRIKQEYSSVSDEVFKNAFLSYVSRYPNLFWDNNKKNMEDVKLKDIRGKIVVLYNLNGLNFGLDYSHFFSIQDNYELSNAEEKKSYIKDFLNQSDNWKNCSLPIINYTSAQGNSTHTPEDLAKTINPWIFTELSTNIANHTGIVAMDFVNSDINTKIIEKNFSDLVKFEGLGDNVFSNLMLRNNELTINYQTSSSGPHLYFNDDIYSSYTIYNANNQLQYTFKGNVEYPSYQKKVLLNDGDWIAVYHAEPTRLIDTVSINNGYKTKFYVYNKGKLMAENPVFLSINDAKVKQRINEELNQNKITARYNRNQEEEIIKQEFRQINTLNLENSQITNLRGLESGTNLTSLNLSNNDLSSNDLSILNPLSKLQTLNLHSTHIKQEQLNQLPSLLSSLTTLDLSNNHLYDLTTLRGRGVNYALGNQTIDEKTQEILNGYLNYKIKPIKNIDGSTPTISCSNGGIYNESTGMITWKNLPKNIKEVSYNWIGQDSFSGTVKIPVTQAEWGLSVPATLKLDKDADNGKTKWGYAKFEIVSADGSVFKDTTKDRTFNVKGKPKNEEDATNDRLRIISQDGKIAYNLMMNALIQGAEDPTNWNTAAVGSGYSVSNKASFNIESKSDGSIATSRNWLVGMHDESKNLTEYLSGKNLSGIISWTATEN